MAAELSPLTADGWELVEIDGQEVAVPARPRLIRRGDLEAVQIDAALADARAQLAAARDRSRARRCPECGTWLTPTESENE